ncbi:hypothetical protein FGG08_005197 [Glutinoglossum americanum]|uniref:Spermine/spermidine synthase n=1 Tax=Glutinoglossum americanum TaxID=1670608 RepID=A0A9P8HYW5_9PEZI|nr:hypothetical protein FGG08_005197 [Glutinoglossum americanum]
MVPQGHPPTVISSSVRAKTSEGSRRVRRTKTIRAKRVLPPVRVFMLILLASCYSPVSQLTLSPVYGSIPSSLYHSRIVTAIFFFAWITAYIFSRYFPPNLSAWLPVLAAWIPVIQYRLFPHSYYYGPVKGPVITEGLTYFPLLYLSISSAAHILENLDLGDLFAGQSPILVNFASGSACYWLFRSLEKIATSLFRDHRPSSTSFILTRSGLQYALGALYALLSPSSWLLLTVPALLHSTLWNVHNPLSHTTALLNSTLQTHSNYQILARRDSLTGYLSVLDNTKDRFRVLRCDHSLLGGEWLLPPRGSEHTSKVREPVYAVFVMLEAVRLIEITNKDGQAPAPQPEALSISADKSAAGAKAAQGSVGHNADSGFSTKDITDENSSQKTALVIGLGIGTSATALIAHGINTTIVEIDPVVHEFAEQYFGLPPNHTAVIEDAVTFVVAAQNHGPRYSYIIHDVFTGGAEPATLFTIDFIASLRDLLTPDGVIAINYGGDLLTPSARLIVRTVRAVFPVCRIFRENETPSDAELESRKRDFTNLVIFCTKSDSPFSFRKPAEKDFLESYARQSYLWPKYEVDQELFHIEDEEEQIGVLRTGKTMQMLERWQEHGALGHWAIMRTVIPDQVWEKW